MSKIAIILTPDYADWEITFITAIGRSYYGLETVTASPNGQTITSAGGIKTIPDMSLEDISADDFNVLVLCGGTTWAGENAPNVDELVGSFLDAGKTVGAICAATLPLAKAGLLNTRKHTSNDPNFLSATGAGYSGKANYQDILGAVADKNIITAPGIAPVQFAAEVLRAAGVDEGGIAQFKGMLAAEHALTLQAAA